jgi:hypothetical protein
MKGAVSSVTQEESYGSEEEKGELEKVSGYCVAFQCVDTLQWYISEKGFACSDIIAAYSDIILSGV